MLRTTLLSLCVALGWLAPVRAPAQVTFTDVTASAGTGLGETTTRGLAWVDFNNDGLPDLYVPTSGSSANKLYKNNGNGTFTEVAASVGLNDLTNTITCTWADFDNDGDLDLLTTAQGAGAKLWRNNLRPNNDTSFTDITASAGINLTNAQMSAWADYNLDGFLDFYSPVASTSSPDALYRNNQNATFSNVADSAGLNHQVSGISEQGMAWGDHNRDGLPDIFIGSLTGQSFFHRNNGNGTFTETAAGLGFQGTARGAQWVDFNNDGLWDLSIAGYSGSTAVPVKLFKNNGDGTFTDVAAAAGITDGVISWGVTWADYDNNGYEDLFVDAFGQSTSCVLYRNNGNGTLTNVTNEAGLAGLTQLSTVWGDYDGDGDMDLYGAGTGTTGNRLFRNNGDSTRKWLEINLAGTSSNRSGVGAQIEVHAGPLHMIREVNTGVGYRSQNMLTAHFGLGTNALADSIIVFWPNPSHARTVWHNVTANQVLTLSEHQAAPHIVAYPDTLTLVAANSYFDTLWVRNTGDATLFIDSIYTSRNDTLANHLIISRRRFSLAPGDSGSVVLNEVIGINRPLYQFAESLFVLSNDPVIPMTHVVLRGDYSPIGSVNRTTLWQFALYQNSPNPFNPTTTVRFEIGGAGFVSLTVFDVLGREVATLVNEEMRPGRYERTWDGRAMGSGVYFYRLQAGEFVACRKLLLLK